jgi:hypothetical protein
MIVPSKELVGKERDTALFLHHLLALTGGE